MLEGERVGDGDHWLWIIADALAPVPIAFADGIGGPAERERSDNP